MEQSLFNVLWTFCLFVTIIFYFKLTKLIFLSSNQLCGFFLLVTLSAKWSPCLYLDSWKFSSYFLHLCCWAGGMREQLAVSLAVSQSQPTIDAHFYVCMCSPTCVPTGNACSDSLLFGPRSLSYHCPAVTSGSCNRTHHWNNECKYTLHRNYVAWELCC